MDAGDSGVMVGAGFPGRAQTPEVNWAPVPDCLGLGMCPEELIWNDDVIRKLQNPIRLIAQLGP